MRSPTKFRFKFKKKYIFFIVIFIIILLFILIDCRMRPLVNKMAVYQGKTIATKIVSTAVYDALNADNFTYETLVKVSKNNDGSVASIESNMAEINRLQAKITYNINTQFKDISKERIELSTGTLTGVNMLYGRGPTLSFKIQPVGFVDSKLVSKFTSAGVNQTLHQIILEVNGNASAVIPGFPAEIDVNVNYLIAETIIVGNIPESYTYITGDNRDNLDKILDYRKKDS